MSATRTLRRTAATIAIATAAVVAGLATAHPAHAADGDVRVRLGGVASSMNANGRSDGFTVRFENRTDHPLDNVRTAIVIRLNGLQPDAVRITRGIFGELPKSSNGSGEVTFNEQFGERLGANRDGQTRNYQLTFFDTAPAGRAEIIATAFDASGALGSASDSITVRSANGEVGLTPTPPASTAPTVPAPAQTGPQASIAPLGGGSGATSLGSTASGGVPTILYVMGAILVLIGGGILWMLFRGPRGAAAAPAGEYPAGGYPATAGYPGPGYDTTRQPSLGYPAPRPPHVGAPTAVLPVVHDPRAAVQDPRTMVQNPRAAGPRPAGPGPRHSGPVPGTDPRTDGPGPRHGGPDQRGGGFDPHTTVPGVDPWANPPQQP